MLETLREFFSAPLESLIEVLNTPTIALWGPFAGLLLCGIGLPVPEDIILVAAGFLAGENGWPIMPPIIITYVGILLGDTFIFLVGHYLGRKVLKSTLGRKILSSERLAKSKAAFHKYGIWVNFFGRFLPGVRTAIFFTGGSLKYPFHKFFLMDALAALISAPLFVWVGYFAGEQFSENTDLLKGYMKTVKNYFSLGLLVLLIVLTLIYYFKSRRKNEAGRAQ